MDVMLIVAGALTGLVVGLTGVSDGALMAPLLLSFFGLALLTAVGTDLWFAATIKLFATRIHHRHGSFDWQIAKRLWWGSLPASAATLCWLSVQPVSDGMMGLKKVAIARAVIITALGMLFQSPLHALGRRLRTTEAAQFKAMQVPLTILAGAILAC